MDMAYSGGRSMQAFKTKTFARWAHREELGALKLLAKEMLDLTPVQLAAAVRTGELIKLEV
jgi:hypothetical protein